MNTENFESTVNEKSAPLPASGLARRRLMRAGMAAVPVVLTLSGRSAMATGNCAAGLSPMAWNSVAPGGTCVGSSHTVHGNPLGQSPVYWKPNANGQTFQPPYPWPVAPFDTINTLLPNGLRGNVAWRSNAYLTYEGVASNDPGFANGAKFNAVFGGDSRSFSRILLDETGSSLEWHFCAAYLNVLAMGGTYAVTLAELQALYTYGTLVTGGAVLTSSNIKTFLAQTWN